MLSLSLKPELFLSYFIIRGGPSLSATSHSTHSNTTHPEILQSPSPVIPSVVEAGTEGELILIPDDQ